MADFSIKVFPALNDAGEALYEEHIRPLCKRLGVKLTRAQPKEYRQRSLSHGALPPGNHILWDGSVETGHVFHAIDEWAKTSRRHVIVSRTPLPRNVLTHYQCAPMHGHSFTNEELGEWLGRQLNSILHDHYSSAAYQHPRLAHHYWMRENPADAFLSFRGTHEAIASDWAVRFHAAQGRSVRMVPKNEYAYPTECVTQQQMWEGVARLMHEMRASKQILIFYSSDYFDSFWTASELFTMLWMLGRDRRTGRSMLDSRQLFWVRDPHHTDLQPFPYGMIELGIPTTASDTMDRFVGLINNCDPFTSAPETRIPPRGPTKVLAWLLRGRFGYFDPEFLSDSFWETVRVPCPQCRPHQRSPRDVNWERHLALPDDTYTIDYYGYFPVQASDLARGALTCPNGHGPLRLVNRRPPRTLWVPIQSTEKDKDRPVIQQTPLWEVAT